MDKGGCPNDIKANGMDDNASISSRGNGDTTLSDIISAPPPPTLSMVTKHLNGSLNLWQLTFADKSKFSQVIFKNRHSYVFCRIEIKKLSFFFSYFAFRFWVLVTLLVLVVIVFVLMILRAILCCHYCLRHLIIIYQTVHRTLQCRQLHLMLLQCHLYVFILFWIFSRFYLLLSHRNVFLLRDFVVSLFCGVLILLAHFLNLEVFRSWLE